MCPCIFPLVFSEYVMHPLPARPVLVATPVMSVLLRAFDLSVLYQYLYYIPFRSCAAHVPTRANVFLVDPQRSFVLSYFLSSAASHIFSARSPVHSSITSLCPSFFSVSPHAPIPSSPLPLLLTILFIFLARSLLWWVIF